MWWDKRVRTNGSEMGELARLFVRTPLRQGCSLPQGTGKAPLTWGSDDLLPGTSGWEVIGSFQNLPFLKFLQLKIFNMPRCHILGLCVLNPRHRKCNSVRKQEIKLLHECWLISWINLKNVISMIINYGQLKIKHSLYILMIYSVKTEGETHGYPGCFYGLWRVQYTWTSTQCY